jgi:hypothetical protein
MPFELLRPRHERKTETIVDHHKASGGKLDAPAIDARHITVSAPLTIGQIVFARERSACFGKVALAQRAEQIARQHEAVAVPLGEAFAFQILEAACLGRFDFAAKACAKVRTSSSSAASSGETMKRK